MKNRDSKLANDLSIPISWLRTPYGTHVFWISLDMATLLAPVAAVISGLVTGTQSQAAMCWVGMAGLVRMQYHVHDCLHGQLGYGGFRVASVLSPFFLVDAHNWVNREHGPHHAHVNNFSKDPDDFDKVLVDKKPASMLKQVLLVNFGADANLCAGLK